MDYVKNKKKEEMEHIVSYDMQLHFLHNKSMADEADEDAAAELGAHLSHRIFFDNLFDEVYPDFDQMNAVTQPEDYDCLRFMIGVTEDACGRLDDYTLKFVKRLVHTCETGDAEEINHTAGLIAGLCNQTI
jgi:hypothetical protein